MTQQSHSQAYTLRNPKLKETHISHCSLQHYLQQRGHKKQPRCPTLDKCIKKQWYIYSMEYYSAIKRNEIESVLMRWMNLEPIIQSKVSQKEKNKYCILTYIYIYIYRLQNDDINDTNYRSIMEAQAQKTDLWTWVGERKERVG